MLQSISWSQYFTFLLIALLIYYPMIIFLFYRKELASVIKRRGNTHYVPGMTSLSFQEENDDNLLMELRDVHLATTHCEFPKEELMLTIIQKVKQYRNVNKELINQFMVEAFPQLEEHDRRRIWQ